MLGVRLTHPCCSAHRSTTVHSHLKHEQRTASLPAVADADWLRTERPTSDALQPAWESHEAGTGIASLLAFADFVWLRTGAPDSGRPTAGVGVARLEHDAYDGHGVSVDVDATKRIGAALLWRGGRQRTR